MPKFNVRIAQTELHFFTVEAGDPTEAAQKALELFRDGVDGYTNELQDAQVQLIIPNTTD